MRESRSRGFLFTDNDLKRKFEKKPKNGSETKEIVRVKHRNSALAYSLLGRYERGFRIELRDAHVLSTSSGQAIIVSPGETLETALTASTV